MQAGMIIKTADKALTEMTIKGFISNINKK